MHAHFYAHFHLLQCPSLEKEDKKWKRKKKWSHLGTELGKEMASATNEEA